MALGTRRDDLYKGVSKKIQYSRFIDVESCCAGMMP